jgi:hypothetical protein
VSRLLDVVNRGRHPDPTVSGGLGTLTSRRADGAQRPERSRDKIVRMRLSAVGLLAFAAVLYASPSAAEGSPAARAQLDTVMTVAQQPSAPAVSTIPPLVSTIPPLPPTQTIFRPTPTQVQAPNPPPTRFIPPIPTLAPLRPTIALPASTQLAPNAGGFPTELAMLLLVGSVTALGGGLWMFARSRTR